MDSSKLNKIVDFLILIYCLCFKVPSLMNIQPTFVPSGSLFDSNQPQLISLMGSFFLHLKDKFYNKQIFLDIKPNISGKNQHENDRSGSGFGSNRSSVDQKRNYVKKSSY
jgi:hypothetical protein